MPEVAAWATAAIASAITGGSTTAAAAAAATAVATTIVSVGSQVLLSAAITAGTLALQGTPRAEGTATAFRLDTDAGLPFAFGRIATGGVINYRKGFGATNRYQGIVCTLAAAGPIRSHEAFYADDELTSFGANDVATSGDHSGAMWLQRKLGTQPQTALTSPTGLELSVTAPGWTSDHKMSGRACVMWTLFENSKLSEYKGGLPKPLHVIEGKYGWDPRLDGTWPGGTGSCRLLTPSTWVWIENPAIAALNWAIGMWEGDGGASEDGTPYACSLVGGIGSSLDGIDVAAFINAANVADANGWTIAAYPSTKDDKFVVLANMLQAAGAVPSRNAGRISCVSLGESQASIVTVSRADTVGAVEVSLGQSRLERINTILPRHWSEDHRWEMVQLGPISDSAWVTQDGGKRTRGLDYPYVTEKNQAAQLAYYAAADAREAISGTVTFKPHLRRIQPGDCFTFDEPGFLLDGVKVKCLKRSYDPISATVRITFRQETDAKHTTALTKVGVAPPAASGSTPPGVYVEPPSSFSVSVSGPTVTLEWRNPGTLFDAVRRYRGATSSFGSATLIGASVGALLEARTATDTPGAGTWFYWLTSVDFDGNESEPVGPVSAAVADLILTEPGDYLLAESGAFINVS